MARKKKLYLVWQASGCYDTYNNRLCGVYDNQEMALELKDRLDNNLITEDNCWTVVPKDVYCNWPINEDDSTWEYIEEYMGYTRDQREQQEVRWSIMMEEYYEAVIIETNLNEER